MGNAVQERQEPLPKGEVLPRPSSSQTEVRIGPLYPPTAKLPCFIQRIMTDSLFFLCNADGTVCCRTGTNVK